MSTGRSLRASPLEAAIALPLGFTGLLVVAAVSASWGDRLGVAGLRLLACIVTAATCLLAEPVAAVPLGVLGWLTAASFGVAPYGTFDPHGATLSALAVAASAAAGTAAGAGLRAWLPRSAGSPATRPQRLTMDGVRILPLGSGAAGLVTGHGAGRWGISRRRQLTALAVTVVGLPLLTVTLAAVRPHLALVDDLLLYLAAVIAITLVGGFWPAVLAAASSSVLLNWYFTPPLHTWTIAAPENLLALLLFVTVAVTVSSVVHLAARRAVLAARLAAESQVLLELARTVLGGDDTADAVLDHLHATLGLSAELRELVGAEWVRVAGTPEPASASVAVQPRGDLELRIYGTDDDTSPVLAAFAAQAAAALDRSRLRVQATQAEALAEANRMRTALLAAVSHDLRTPLASVKASVSTLRQNDVAWTREDQAELLATIEEGADRLNALIGNLLDMSRIQTGALQPFVRPTALDEVAPVVLHGMDGGARVQLLIPDDLPLVAADPGLLERALANLVANALRYSPADRPPAVVARAVSEETVRVDVVDHGPGVPESKRELILRPLQQLGDRRFAGGVGLGLAVAKGFVEVMGGRLAVTDTPGGGLTMRIELRAARPASSIVAVESSTDPGRAPR